jgi:hypothetical protein
VWLMSLKTRYNTSLFSRNSFVFEKENPRTIVGRKITEESVTSPLCPQKLFQSLFSSWNETFRKATYLLPGVF